MIINVRVQSKASRDKVEKIADNEYKIYTMKAAVEGNANKAVIQILADHMKIKKRQIIIKTGIKSRNKIVEIKL